MNLIMTFALKMLDVRYNLFYEYISFKLDNDH